MKQGVNCPACGESFSKLKKWACPHCQTPLTLVQEKVGQKNVNRYILTRPPKEDTPNRDVDHFVFGTINAVREEEQRWAVYVSLLVQTLYCPNCGRAAIWYPDIRQGNLSHKCDKCKHITVYYFRL